MQRTICFVHSPEPQYADLQNYGVRFMPVWAYTLAPYLHQDYQVLLADLGVCGPEEIPVADLYLFSGINQDFHALKMASEACRRIRSASPQICGGPITWSYRQAGERTLEQLFFFDHLFIGDGEDDIAELCSGVIEGRITDKVIAARQRFSLSRARILDLGLVRQSIGNYYGGVVEVSRGCPFLCEFCDIRIMQDNNRPHNKPVALVVEDIAQLYSCGVRQIQLACDNFVGDPEWAEQLVDALLEWGSGSDKPINYYTWVTINLSNYPELLTKMRRAGFDLLFIGIESFSTNSLMETAKVQNAKLSMVETIKTIQSYGFIVIAGLIFGFDSESDDFANVTLEGMRECGLLSGDPGFLFALPGTPLYRRMQLSGRLRENLPDLGRYKYQTNIRYLQPVDMLVEGYLQFTRENQSGRFQYERLMAYFRNLDPDRYVAIKGGGYGNVGGFLRNTLKSPHAIMIQLRRLYHLLRAPSRLAWMIAGFLNVLTTYRHLPGKMTALSIWVFTWTNSLLNYSHVRRSDFDLESIGEDFPLERLIPEGYMSDFDEPIPEAKIRAQRRSTAEQLRRIMVRGKGTPTAS